MRMLNESRQLANTAAVAPFDTRPAGIAIAVSAIASIVFVALDEGARGKDALSIMQSMVATQPMHQFVHVVAMTCLAGLMYGYTVLSQRLGLNRAPVVIGLTSYGLGTVLMLLAAVIDGFVSTDAAAMFVSGAPAAAETGYQIIRTLSGVLLPDLARVAWVFQSVAAISWSIALLRERGMQRTVGAIGLVAGALPAVIVSIVGTQMTDAIVVGILLAQAVWNLAAATLLVFEIRTGRGYVSGRMLAAA
jgi:hypothetical protein